jgi:hypothetical protein
MRLATVCHGGARFAHRNLRIDHMDIEFGAAADAHKRRSRHAASCQNGAARLVI